MALNLVRATFALNVISFIDVFFKHRWYSRNHKRDGASLIQAWNAFIHKFGEIGRDTWLDKLTLSHNLFEKRTFTGAHYELHSLSRGVA